MNLQFEKCDAERIAGFLNHRLSDDQQTALELHLSECEKCRQLLRDQTAHHEVWEKASRYLRDDEGDLFALASLSSCSSDGESRTLIVDRVLESLAPTDDPEMLGRIDGYEISGVIGCGGMGVVLKGFDRTLNRVVAVKVMAPHLAASGAARKRFAREAQAAAAITHDNVIDIYGVSEANGLPYLVMPYARGTTLQRRIDERGPLPVVEVLRIACQIAAGLAAAHQRGLVHRDVKPANILLDDGIERLVITDFGLARAVDDASITRTGVIAGTPQYMSPEQARGESTDHRSDLFSLGSVMYTLCTGRAPFRAETTYGILRRITDSTPRPISEINSEIPVWLSGIIEKLHAKRPNDRYSSASEVVDLLQSCLAHTQNPMATPLPDSLKSLKPVVSGRLLGRFGRHFNKGVAVAVTMLGMGLLALFATSGTPAPETQNEKPAPAKRASQAEELDVESLEKGPIVKSPNGKLCAYLKELGDGSFEIRIREVRTRTLIHRAPVSATARIGVLDNYGNALVKEGDDLRMIFTFAYDPHKSAEAEIARMMLTPPKDQQADNTEKQSRIAQHEKDFKAKASKAEKEAIDLLKKWISAGQKGNLPQEIVDRLKIVILREWIAAGR